MRYPDLLEAKKKPKPRPSLTLEVKEHRQFKSAIANKPKAVKDTVFDFVEQYLNSRQNPNDFNLANHLKKKYDIHPLPQYEVISADITKDLRLWFKVEVDKNDKSKGKLVLANLKKHDQYR